MVFQATIIDW